MPGIAPLVEVGGGLVILDTSDDGTVDDHLLVRLHLAADHPEGVGGGVVIDLDAAEGLRARAGGQPALVAVIIEHHRGPAGAHNRLAHGCSAGGRSAHGLGAPGAPLARGSEIQRWL